MSALVHNCPALHAALHQDSCPGHAELAEYKVREREDGTLQFDTEEEGAYPEGFNAAYAAVVKHVFNELGCKILPAAPADHGAWVRAELSKSTARLAQAATSSEGAETLLELMASMRPGAEAAHMADLLRLADHRGTQVRIDQQCALVSRQHFPYPAILWNWATVQSYPWVHGNHINALEMLAFLNYLRSKSNQRVLHGLRWLHIFDSLVSTAAVAKGRSSSKRLNRICRKIAAQVLGMDIYPASLWTISRWMYADAASRLYDPP